MALPPPQRLSPQIVIVMRRQARPTYRLYSGHSNTLRMWSAVLLYVTLDGVYLANGYQSCEDETNNPNGMLSTSSFNVYPVINRQPRKRLTTAGETQ